MNDPIFAARITNLVICTVVVLYGFRWLKPAKPKLNLEIEMRYRVFIFWWVSWLVWIPLWATVCFGEMFGISENVRQAIDLTLSNVNAIALLNVYFAMMTPEEYTIGHGLVNTVRVALPLALGYGAVYVALHDNIRLAIQLHHTWSLSMDMASSILVGWAFRLRFNTKVVLWIGFMYAFVQPIAYEAALKTAPAQLNKTFAVSLMVLAFLKIIWASVFVHILSTGKSSAKNIVQIDKEAHFQFWSRWPAETGLQVVLLAVTYIFFAIVFMHSYVTGIAAGLTLLILFGTVGGYMVSAWNKLGTYLISGPRSKR